MEKSSLEGRGAAVEESETGIAIAKAISEGSSRRFLTGINAFRALAAFRVIYVHSPLVAGGGAVQVANQWVTSYFPFSVPFFLLTAFYFGARTSQQQAGFKAGLAKSAKRLLPPYLFWTAVYLVLKSAKFAVQHKPVGLVFSDPVGLLVGGAAVHLYFIPLLFTGIAVQRGIAPSIRNSTLKCGLLLALALLAKIAMERTGNGFNPDHVRAFEPLINTRAWGFLDAPARLLLVLLSHTVRCLPLILLSFILIRSLPDFPYKSARFTILLVVSTLVALELACFSRLTLLNDELLGLMAFLSAWLLSAYVPENALVKRFGAFSYGIYLSHLVFLEMLQVGAARLHIVHWFASFPALLLLSAGTFMASWGLLQTANRQGKGIRMLAGLG